MEKGKLGRSMMLIVITLFAAALTQGQEKLGQTGIQILDIGMSPRAEALGGAFVVAGTEADALFYNPAGIARSTTMFDVTINRVQWFADMNYNSIGATIRPWEGDYGVFGLNFMNADYGDFYGTRVAAGTPAGYEDTGLFSPKAFAIGLSYARTLTDRFSIGAQAKYVTQQLGSNVLTFGGPEKTNEVGGFAFDFGLIYRTPIEGFDFGMSVKNFATDFKYEQYSFEAPLTFRIGLQFRLMPMFGLSSETHNFLLLADAVHPRDSGEHMDVGAEYTFQGLISLRGGYKFNYSELGLTGGLGVNYDVMKGLNVRVDYSYGSFGIWNAVHRFSVGFTL